MKTQKILSQFGLLLAIALAFASCSKTKLQIQLELANKQCPISLGEMGEISGITYEDNVVTFNYEMNEEYIDFDQIKANSTAMKENVIIFLQNSEGAIKNLIAEIKNDGAGLAMAYKGKQSGKTFTITLTPEEIASMSEASQADTEPASALDALLKNANMQLPREDAQGMITEKIVVEGDYVVSMIKVDEEIYSIADLNAGKELTKEILKETLKGMGPVVDHEMKVYKNAGKGIAYKYIGNKSGEVYLIEIAASDL